MRASDGGSTHSIWSLALPSFDHPPAPETDVCIIGAGIAGLTTAYELARRGTQVTVLDDGPIGGGETGRTSAHLASAVDDRFHRLESRFGIEGTRVIAASHAAAIDYIETTVQELAIACDFRRVDGFLFAPPDSTPGRDSDRELDRELAAAQRAGVAVDRVDRAPLPFDTGAALRFMRQAEFHPLRYLRGLADAVIAAGGHIHTGVHVHAIEPGAPLRVRLAGDRSVLCRIAVDATGSTLTSPVKLTVRQAAYRSYVVAFEIEAGAIPHALYWDTADPYHYVRVARDGDTGRELLIVGGGDHRTGHGDPVAAFDDLVAWGRRWFPMTGTIATMWSGQILEPVDGVAHIGRSPDLAHVYVVSGDSGNGLTHGTIAGMLLPELMRGLASPWAAVYDPRRSHVHALATWIKEASRSTAPYARWLRGGDVASIDDIERGRGAVVRRGLQLIAAYRDDAGVCHLSSASCPHMRGAVVWNAAEQTWDCPCHGSRFDPYGRVVNGPATSDLARIDEPREPVGRPVRDQPVPVGPVVPPPGDLVPPHVRPPQR